MPRLRPQFPSGPCRIAIVGEAPGKSEELLGEPFVGASGQELTRMLAEAGIARSACYITNVFLTRPPDNKILNWCASKKDVGGKAYPYPSIQQGKYLRLEHIHDVQESDIGARDPGGANARTVLERLRNELQLVSPNLVIALGNTACWALLGTSGIKAIRGTATLSTLVPGLKVIPTYHPAMVLRDWSARTVCVFDFLKTLRESDRKSIIRPERFVHIEPTVTDLFQWEAKIAAGTVVSFDIETGAQMMKCIGFSVDERDAYVVPFFDLRKPGGNYWPDAKSEKLAWQVVRRILNSHKIKLAQNGFYDIQYLWRAGVPTKNFSEDTMLAHHALQPELQKSLGFLGSIYTDEASWKLLRPRSDDIAEKKDE